MKKEEKFICDFVSDFVFKNWDKIDKKKCEITKTKAKFLEEISKNVETAIWVVTEVAVWSMDKEYLKEIYVKLPENYNFMVWEIKNKYIKLHRNDSLSNRTISFTYPKQKVVIYFD